VAAYLGLSYNEINTFRWNYSSVRTCKDNCRFRNHATAQLMADDATMAGNMTGAGQISSATEETNIHGGCIGACQD
jgi:hypothetical protein